MADSKKIIALAEGAEDKCPECGSALVAVQPTVDASHWTRNELIIAGVLSLVLIGGIGFAYWAKIEALMAGPPKTTATVIASAPVAVPVPVVPVPVPPPAPEPVLADESLARKTCDDSTKNKRADSERICRHAAAITLMNSGALAAVHGNLDQAEKDYLAAKDKDSDIPELYFNIAILKARQNKGAEAVDNLALAESRGFTKFSEIKNEPSLQKLKKDPQFKARIESLEARSKG